MNPCPLYGELSKAITQDDIDCFEQLRPERTCHDDTPDYLNTFVCSECRALVRNAQVGESYLDKEGKRWFGTSNKHSFNFCPSCGAHILERDIND